MSKAKSFDIPKSLVFTAFKAVKKNKGSAGIDKISIEKYEKNLKNNLYKLWNRMSSGTYFPNAVKAVEIPKKNGGIRVLGVPTVEDRIAQMIVRLSMERIIDPIFLNDSYGYRPNRSAHDAIKVTRSRCWKYDWVLEFDIKGLFDNINHKLLLKAVYKYARYKWEILYIKRWLANPVSNNNKITKNTENGTPQGGVISPLLANLFLHFAFDKWMERRFPNNKWCRYADDGIIHCNSRAEAIFILNCLKERMKECKLEIHPGKTKIIYCKDSNRKENHKLHEFTFLGYSFRPRKAKGINGSSFTSFLPAISNKAKKHIRSTIKSWYLLHQTQITLAEVADKYNSVLRGWLNYYGLYGKNELKKVLHHMNDHLVMWVIRKFDKLKTKKMKARKLLNKIAKENPNLFSHWTVGVLPMTG